MALGDVRRGNAPANLAGGMPSVQTFGSAATTLLTVEVPDKHAGIIEVGLVACEDFGSYHAAQWFHAVRRDGAAATYLGGLAGNAAADSVWLVDATTVGIVADCTGTTFRIIVTGEAGHTYEWMGSARWVVLGQYKA
jgi:hypothetical protein